MRTLILTNNIIQGSTTRILQSWLPLGRQTGLDSCVVVAGRGTFADWLESNNIDHRVEQMPWPNRRWVLPSMWHAVRIWRWLRQYPIDVIHCNEHDLYPFGLLLRRLLRRPLVCHVRFRLERAFCEWTFRNKRRQPDAMFWTSYQQRDDCLDAIEGIVPAERQHVLRLGIDKNLFGKNSGSREQTRASWGFRPDDVVVGMASPMRPRKRVEDFITLVAHLARTNPRVVGVLAGDMIPNQGDEGYREKILRQIQETGLNERFRWLGHVEPIEPFMHALDLFVSTSGYETFGMSVCEAMTCRRPVVGYRGGSVHEVVGDAGRIVETGDLAALIAAASDLVNRPDLREQLGRQGAERIATQFNPADSLRQLQKIYASLTTTSDGR